MTLVTPRKNVQVSYQEAHEHTTDKWNPYVEPMAIYSRDFYGVVSLSLTFMATVLLPQIGSLRREDIFKKSCFHSCNHYSVNYHSTQRGYTLIAWCGSRAIKIPAAAPCVTLEEDPSSVEIWGDWLYKVVVIIQNNMLNSGNFKSPTIKCITKFT